MEDRKNAYVSVDAPLLAISKLPGLNIRGGFHNY